MSELNITTPHYLKWINKSLDYIGNPWVVTNCRVSFVFVIVTIFSVTIYLFVIGFPVLSARKKERCTYIRTLVIKYGMPATKRNRNKNVIKIDIAPL